MRAALSFVLASFVLAACADQTGVLVQISSSDIAVPSEIDALHIRARTPDALPLMVDQTFPIRSSWPQSLLIRPADGEALGELQVEVTGTLGGTFVVQRSVMTAFMPGQVRHLDVELSRTCVGMMCGPYNDCVAGVCQGMAPDAGVNDGGIDAAVPPDVGTDGGTDGGTDAGPDAAGPCAGATCLGHVVISEMSTYMANEFIELYNRSPDPADVSGCAIEYSQTSTWSPRGMIAAGTTIASHGYLLLGNVGYTGTPAADQLPWNTGFADANAAVRITCGGTTIDLLGYGSGAMQHEGTPVGAIDASLLAAGSYERRALADSTAATMSAGGRDVLAGNAYDTGDNASDFITRSMRDPQSSTSAHEP